MTMSTTDESVHVRPLRAEDAAWVQPLYAANSRDALTPEQRAEHVLTATAAAHRAAVAFVEDENTASMAAHTRLGGEPVGRFEHEGRGFTVLTHATTGTGASA